MLKKILAGGSVFLLTAGAFAAHPLVTDDIGTQGKGKLQIEINSEVTYDRETEDSLAIKEIGGGAEIILSYGITNNADIILGLPYRWKEVKEGGDVALDNHGLSDVSIELKWRLCEEEEGFGCALKPGITLPAGNENKGLGNGRVSYRLAFITTTEIAPWTFHLNLGCRHNGYKLHDDKDANRKDIWHASLATEFNMGRDIKAVADIGAERNPDRTSNTHPAFILGGIIYSISENFDIDFGIKSGLNRPEIDLTILVGSALRF